MANIHENQDDALLFDTSQADQFKIINQILSDEIEMCDTLGMTLSEYRLHTSEETVYLKKLQNDNKALKIFNVENALRMENTYHADNVFISEKLFIEINLRDIGAVKSDIDTTKYLIGEHTSGIIRDLLYAGLRSINRNIIDMIMGYYQIINIDDTAVLLHRHTIIPIIRTKTTTKTRIHPATKMIHHPP